MLEPEDEPPPLGIDPFRKRLVGGRIGEPVDAPADDQQHGEHGKAPGKRRDGQQDHRRPHHVDLHGPLPADSPDESPERWGGNRGSEKERTRQQAEGRRAEPDVFLQLEKRHGHQKHRLCGQRNQQDGQNEPPPGKRVARRETRVASHRRDTSLELK